MRRSLFSLAPFLLFTLSLLLLLVACTAPVSTQLSPTPTLTLTPPPSVSLTLEPSATFTPTTRPTRRPTITIAPTRTPVPSTPYSNEKSLSIEITDLPSNYLQLLWVNDLLFKIVLLDQREILYDISDPKNIQMIEAPVPTPFNSIPMENLSVSPNGLYAIECSKDGVNLYSLKEGELIASADIFTDCYFSVAWAHNDTKVSIVADIAQNSEIYVWPIDGTEPFVVGRATPYSAASWSPDLNFLAAITGAGTEEATFSIIDIRSTPKIISSGTIEAGNNWFPRLRWLTNGIVENIRGCGIGCRFLMYYDIKTGKYLTGYQFDEFGGIGQIAKISPNTEWLALEQSVSWENNYRFLLFNIESKDEYLISENQILSIEFLNWRHDSTRLFMITRPIDETTQPESALPSGLLALDANTRQFTQIIPGAMYATLNPQQTHAFTLAPSPLPENGHLTAAIYTLSGDLLATFQPVTDHIPYLTPGEGLPIHAAWSNDGTQIVFSDVWGDLWLADTSGALTQLADNLGFDSAYPRQPRFSWSPDDSHLLITFNDRAWVMTVP